ncbi:MAG: hypothetical protein GX141_09565 [Armatimonadetes bacterium]|nr:hypothetical protein [Armatimonadota bacterium]
MKKPLFWILTLTLLMWCAAAGASRPRAVVVIAASSSIRDFCDPDLPEFAKLFTEGSAALLNVRTGRSSRDSLPASKSGFEAGCLSLGAGAMASGGGEVRLAGNATETINGEDVASLYQYRTGHKPATGQILHSEIARISRINETASYRAQPGALGSALRDADLSTAVLGNSDIPGEMHRECAAAAMDGFGIVDFGQMDGHILNELDPTAPFGVRINASVLLREYDKLPQRCRFVVIDYGDMFRADSYAEYCLDALAKNHRKIAAKGLDDFVRELSTRLDPDKDLFIVLSPNPRSFSDLAGEKMGAIIIRGPGFGGGVLTSSSTRRSGVATLSDVAPTILKFFGIQTPPGMVGRPITSVGASDVAVTLLDMNAKASAQAERQVIMRATSIAQSVMVALVLFAIFATSVPSVKRVASWLVVCFASLPVVMLLMPLIYSGGMVGSIVMLVALTFAVTAVGGLILKTPQRTFVWLCAICIAAMMVDLLCGAELMASSIASYNIVEGARYYGIGNELMGTMLGAAIIGAGMALSGAWIDSRIASVLACAVLGIVLAFVAAPMLGANVGGALAMAPAMGTMLIARRGWRPNLRSLIVVGLITLLAVIGMFAMDALRTGSDQSHIGRTANIIAGGNVAALVDIFQRKIALNWMLLSTSLWSRLLGISLAASISLYWFGRRAGGSAFLNQEESAAAIGCSVGVFAAFIFNDSGVVAAATCSVFLFAMFAFKLLQKNMGGC